MVMTRSVREDNRQSRPESGRLLHTSKDRDECNDA
jgi:hypothetical protein